MTDAEHRAMDLIGDLVKLVEDIVGDGSARRSDLGEFKRDIHVLQHRILKQAAARAYPDRYRLLGGWPDIDGIDN